MPVFLQENMGNIVVGLVLLVAIVLAVRSVYKARKQGSCSCGVDCGSCGAACHDNTTN